MVNDLIIGVTGSIIGNVIWHIACRVLRMMRGR